MKENIQREDEDELGEEEDPRKRGCFLLIGLLACLAGAHTGVQRAHHQCTWQARFLPFS